MSESSSSLRTKTIGGITWITAAQIGKQAVQFLFSLLLARLLTPDEFGLMGMILVFTGFAQLFGELGFSAALIQHENINESHYSSVFWLNILTGFVLTGVFIISAPFVARFYNEGRLTSLIFVISFNFLIQAIGIVHRAILSRTLQFRSLAIVEFSTVLVAGLFGVFLAYIGYGVWSLVWKLMITSMFTSIALWGMTKWRPKLIFNTKALKDLIGFSTNLLGFNIFNYWTRNTDNLLIGKTLGSVSLGLYARAYSTMLLPLSQVTQVFTKVMFPVFSRMQDDKLRIKRIYLRLIAMISLVTFPVMLGLFVVSDELIFVLYGEKWIGMSTTLKILALVGLVQSIAATVGWIYQSQGRTDWMFKWGVFSNFIMILSFLIGVYFGSIESVAWCYLIASMAILYWNFAIPGKLVNMTFSDVFRSVSGVFGCALVMASTVWIIRFLIYESMSLIALLSIEIILGSVIYAILLVTFKVQAFIDLAQIVYEKIQNVPLLGIGLNRVRQIMR